MTTLDKRRKSSMYFISVGGATSAELVQPKASFTNLITAVVSLLIKLVIIRWSESCYQVTAGGLHRGCSDFYYTQRHWQIVTWSFNFGC